MKTITYTYHLDSVARIHTTYTNTVANAELDHALTTHWAIFDILTQGR